MSQENAAQSNIRGMDVNKSKLVSELIGDQKVLPVVVIENEEQALGLAQALLDGGINVIEITLRNAYGIKAIEVIKKNFPDMFKKIFRIIRTLSK